jgi:ribosomal protein S18 acetylase RimI-like enzyme
MGVSAPETNGTGLRLREFVEADEDKVGSWFADAGELRFFAGTRLTWPLDHEQWSGLRLDPGVSAWTAVARDESVPLGHGELVAESTSVVRFARIAIAPNERGRGLGREMLSQLVEKSRQGGYALATLFVHPDNSTAIRGYRSLGFESAAEQVANGRLRMQLVLQS